MIASLVDPSIGLSIERPRPALRHIDEAATRQVAECFLNARTTRNGLVARAYHDLERQTDRQYAALVDPDGPYRLRVVSTGNVTPYDDADQLIESVLSTRTLEITSSAADRTHPLLDGAVAGAYHRFRAVHDLVGHVATRFGFDADGEYSAWLVQRRTFRGLARWAAATELHGEISALWTTKQFADHKAALLAPDLFG